MGVGDIEDASYEQNKDQSRDEVTIFIEEKLQEIPCTVSKCSIFRVPKRLFQMNPTAYVPQVISIGPYHHNKDSFKAREELKFRFLNSYLSRTNMSSNIQDIVEKARSWNNQARQCYSESIEMNDDEFVKMMILDGCFLVEFMIMMVNCSDNLPESKKKVDLSLYGSIEWDIIRDLTMLENQLPFFVLQALFDLLAPTNSNNNFPSFEEVVHVFLSTFVLPIQYQHRYYDPNNGQKPQHIVEFLSYYFVHPGSHDIQTIRHVPCLHKSLPPSATDLYEAGIILMKAEERNMVDISLKNGVLKIPPFEIDDNFEIQMRNLVAFEQFSVNKNKFVMHYIAFLDELICSEKDVSLLVKGGILINRDGRSHTEISKFFNDICKNVTADYYSPYIDISENLRMYCRTSRKGWTTFIFSAATFLIFLTILQTIFSAVPVFKP